MITGAVSAAVGSLAAAVDGLLAAPVEQLEAAELVKVIEAVEVQRRRLAAVDATLIAAAERAGAAGAAGRPGVVEVLTDRLRLDPGPARARVQAARELGPRTGLTGEPLPPLLAATAAAVAAGDVSAEQVAVISWCLDRIPPAAPAAAWPVAEQLLLQAARVEAPRALRRTAAALLARLDPDGPEPAEEQGERRRGFTLVQHPDGSSSPRGRWTAETTALWQAVLDALAAPQPTEDGPDPRTGPQRRHDAMAEAAARLLRSTTLPAAGGTPVTVLATITLTDLATAAGGTVGGTPGGAGCPAAASTGARAGAAGRATTADPAGPGRRGPAPGVAGQDPDRGWGMWLGLEELAELAGLDPNTIGGADARTLAELAEKGGPAALARLGHGATVSARALLAIACEARLIPVIFNDAGGVLAFGDGRRLASRGQRLALAARDGGCSFPGCDRPAAWTEVHHIRPWAAGGGTDLDNLCLLCRYHHRSFEPAGWTVRMDPQGRPEWLPPPWLDPDRTPRRNTTHHPPDLDFRQPQAA